MRCYELAPLVAELGVLPGCLAAFAGWLGLVVWGEWLGEEGDGGLFLGVMIGAGVGGGAGIDLDGVGLVDVAIEGEPHAGEVGIGAGVLFKAFAGEGDGVFVHGAAGVVDGVDADIGLVGGGCLIVQVGDEQGTGMAACAEALDGGQELR